MAATESPSLREWRQGSVLPQTAARNLRLTSENNAQTHCVVVVSHDCDIVNPDHEPEVEVIVGQIVCTADGNLTGGKNSRKLHLNWTHQDQVCLELRASEKRRIPKSALATVLPEAGFTLDAKNLATLRFWLGARYNRAAFPDAFNNRLRKTKVGDDIIKILKPLGNLVTGVYVQLDTQEELPAENPKPPYRVTLFLAFEPGDEPLESTEKTDAAASDIADAFGNRCFDEKTAEWSWIELKDCAGISEDELTVSQAKKLQQLSLEYLSLRTSPQGTTSLGVRNP
jgi:hypothetical protein